MKKSITSIISIILGVVILAFPILGILAVDVISGISILLLSMFLIINGMAEIDFSPKTSLVYIIFGMLLFILSIMVLFSPAITAFLISLNLYLLGILLMIISLIALIGSRDSKIGYWTGISGITLGILYIIIGSLIKNPIILGSIVGIWLIIAGILKLSDE
ncbi:MAG: DUF308 domain-containing protein [Methanobrevibacter sp.]|jgi:uncharacterized membrane protein HdeD (DUF308 family)|nr:DUF308 domain-containing protein [Candidatus Methanovirga aequatorialis]